MQGGIIIMSDEEFEAALKAELDQMGDDDPDLAEAAAVAQVAARSPTTHTPCSLRAPTPHCPPLCPPPAEGSAGPGGRVRG